MNRLSKAAIATGAAAVLLLGGAGTLAYWSATATATGSGTITTGTLAIATSTPPSCTAWTYSDGTPVNQIVPGDIVTTTCTAYVTGSGDHLQATAEYAGGSWAASNAFTGVATLAPSAVTVDGTALASPTDPIVFGPTASTKKIEVAITASFPFAASPTPADNTTQNLTASLNDVVLTFTQTQTSAIPVA